MSGNNEDPISAIYRQFNQAHTTEANVLEWFYTQVTDMRKTIQSLKIEVVNLQKKNSDIQPNTKKINSEAKKN